MLDMLLKHKSTVAFLDADAIIIKYPELLITPPEGYDLCCFFLDWDLFWKGQSKGRKPHLLSGTMVWNYTPNSVKLAEEFYKKAYLNNEIWEQKILEGIVDTMPELKIYKLPIEYCTILKKGETKSALVADPIIIHTQASREYKNKI
jgi:hypothetical protein